jgi:hypothetical protein
MARMNICMRFKPTLPDTQAGSPDAHPDHADISKHDIFSCILSVPGRSIHFQIQAEDGRHHLGAAARRDMLFRRHPSKVLNEYWVFPALNSVISF